MFCSKCVNSAFKENNTEKKFWALEKQIDFFWQVQVGEPSKPANVKVYGPGVEKGVKTMVKTYFIVDCTSAGPGDIGIALTDGNGRDVPVKTTDQKNGTFRVEYEPVNPGTYVVAVYFAGKEIPSSPIKVPVEASIDLSKVKVVGLDKRKFYHKFFSKFFRNQLEEAFLFYMTESNLLMFSLENLICIPKKLIDSV